MSPQCAWDRGVASPPTRSLAGWRVSPLHRRRAATAGFSSIAPGSPDTFAFADYVALIIADAVDMRARTRGVAAEARRACERAKAACREAEGTVRCVTAVKCQQQRGRRRARVTPVPSRILFPAIFWLATSARASWGRQLGVEAGSPREPITPEPRRLRLEDRPVRQGDRHARHHDVVVPADDGRVAAVEGVILRQDLPVPGLEVQVELPVAAAGV